MPGSSLGVFLDCDTGNVLKFDRLPSAYRGIEQEEWNFRLDELETIEDFAFDPSQNLLVVLTRHATERRYCIDAHMLTLESGRPHLSTTHMKQRVFERKIDGESPEFDIRIFKNRLGILIVSVNDESANELVVWDWYEGRVALRTDDLASFAFLNENLVVFTPIVDSNYLGDVTVVDLDCENSDSSILLHFKLPPFPDLHSVVIHSETHSPTSLGRREVPFGVSQRDRLLVFECHLYSKDVAILAPLSTILRHVEDARSTRGLVLAWEDWGRDGTRLVSATLPDIWVCYVHGLRAVLLDCAGGQPPVSGTRFSLYDLNPLASQRNHHEVERLKPAQDPEGGIPRTNAPCRVLSGLVPDTLPSSIMLSEDALLVVSEDEAEITIYSF
ncbi:hypothetical protein PM082_005386 [Marasmius tenuissimus]|nr:hypothetical protein PM082_005386 [Marasmius tenuissimus]